MKAWLKKDDTQGSKKNLLSALSKKTDEEAKKEEDEKNKTGKFSTPL